jgi:crotonobetainyl-CoA:carnitine CoA-transferase CaiB-like acyl-CoA transferase
MTVVWAGPFATMILGDMGAEVIRVESRQRFPTNTRGYRCRPTRAAVLAMGHTGQMYPDKDPGERPWNRHALFNCHGRNKRSMTVDTERPEGVEIFKRLVRVSDVFIENNSAGVVEKLGLTYEALRPENPGLIMISMPGLGNSGPYKYYQGIGANIEAIAGFSALRGHRDLDPSMAGLSVYMDAASGAGAAFAIQAALRWRDRTGEGQFIDFSQAENMVPHLGGALLDYAMNRRVQTPLGNHHRSAAPQGVYPCAPDPEGIAPDRWLTLTVETDAQFRALCGVIGRPELIADPRFRTVVARLRHQDALDEILAGWTRGQEPVRAMEVLQEAGVPAGAILDDRDAHFDAHLLERGFFHDITHTEAGTHLHPGFAFELSGTPLRFDTPTPCLGEHNEYVYRELLGYDESEYRRLEEEGHIGLDYVPEIT